MHVATLSKFSLKIFMPVSRYWTKFIREYFQFPDFFHIHCKQVITTLEPVMILTWNLRLVTRLNKRNTTTSINLTMTSCHQIMTSSLFFKFMVKMEQSGTRIPDTGFMILTFSSIVAFYHTKNENRTKPSLTDLPWHNFE